MNRVNSDNERGIKRFERAQRALSFLLRRPTTFPKAYTDVFLIRFIDFTNGEIEFETQQNCNDAKASSFYF